MVPQKEYSARVEYRWIPSSPDLKLEKAAGLEYSYKAYSLKGKIDIQSLRIPLMLGFHWGETDKGWNVVPSLGFYADIPLDHTVRSERVYKIPKVHSLSVGYKMRTDLRWRPTPRFMAVLAYEAYIGLTPIYETLAYSPGGVLETSTESQGSLEGYLQLSVLYKLSSSSDGSEEGME